MLVLLPFWFDLFWGIVPADLFLCWGTIQFLPILIQKYYLKKADFALLFFAGVSLLGSKIGLFPESYLKELLTLAFLWIGFQAFSHQARKQRDFATAVRTFAGMFLVVVTILAGGFLGELLGGISFFRSDARKFCWPFPHSNQLGIFVVFGLPFAMIFLRKWFILSRLFIYGVVFLIQSQVGSRGGMLVGLVQICLCEFFLIRERNNLPKPARAVFLLVLVLSLGLFLGNNWAFMRSLGFLPVSGPLLYDEFRATQILQIINSTHEWILKGVGLGCFKEENGLEVHNTILSLAVETGIFGFLSFSFWFFWSFKPIVAFIESNDSKTRFFGKMFLFSLGGIFLLGMVNNLLRNRFFWLLVGLVSGLREMKQGEKRLPAQKEKEQTAELGQIRLDSDHFHQHSKVSLEKLELKHENVFPNGSPV